MAFFHGFPGGSDGKASACNAGDPGSISGSGRSPGEKMAIHSSTPAWKIPWTEEPDRLQSMGSQRVGHEFHFHFRRKKKRMKHTHKHIKIA